MIATPHEQTKRYGHLQLVPLEPAPPPQPVTVTFPSADAAEAALAACQYASMACKASFWREWTDASLDGLIMGGLAIKAGLDALDAADGADGAGVQP